MIHISGRLYILKHFIGQFFIFCEGEMKEREFSVLQVVAVMLFIVVLVGIETWKRGF